MNSGTLATARPPLARTRASDLRWLWLGAGVFLSFLAVGGRWDIALAAWLAPVFLLRFSRDAGALAGIPALLLVSFANAVWWGVQLGVPWQASTAGFEATLGVLFALPYILDRLVARRLGTLARLFVLPTTIVICEFAVATASPLGASYGVRAITQSDHLGLLQITSITGPYGIGFLIGCFATVLNHVWEEGRWEVLRRYGGGLVLALALIVAGGQARLAFDTPPASAPRVTLAGITPPMPLRNEANRVITAGGMAPDAGAMAAARTPAMEALYADIQQALMDETRRAAAAGAQIVVWAETAAPATEDSKAALAARTAALARELGIHIVAGVGVPFRTNETYMFTPDGELLWHYNKNHPVPGMEPVPPSGAAVPAADTAHGRLANVICFDADFPALARVAADILLVPAWDWPEMGRTHTLKMARLRAIENGYSLVRVDYDGQSAAFDHGGRVLATQDTTGPANTHTLFASVPVKGSRTIYNAIGDVFAWACFVALLIFAARAVLALRRGAKAA